jgi:hypothetical protein
MVDFLGRKNLQTRRCTPFGFDQFHDLEPHSHPTRWPTCTDTNVKRLSNQLTGWDYGVSPVFILWANEHPSPV